MNLRAARNWFPLASLAMVLPGFLWAYLDHRPWPWDQAHYAEITLRTLKAFDEGPVAGVASMGVLMSVKPPGLTWLGIPFALLADLFGRPEPALLCATLAFQAGTLLACYWSAWLICRSRLIALATTAFIGSTPVFIAMNHQYLVEPLQTFAVALSFLLALCARDMSRVTLFTALCGVTALAMAAKASSPLYCGLPLLLAAGALVSRRPMPPAAWVRRLRVPLVLLALSGLALVLNWYATYFPVMLEHARQSTVGPVVLSFVAQKDFPVKLAYWTSAYASALFFPSWLVLLAAAVTAGAFAAARSQRPSHSDAAAASAGPAPQPPAGLVAGAAAAHVAAAFIAYSLQANDDPRFLEPLLPATAILLAWLCRRIRLATACAALLAAALAQFVLGYGYALGWSQQASAHAWLMAVERDNTKRGRLQALIGLTCDPGRPHDINLIGVQYPWLNSMSANFYAVVAQGGTPVCRYRYLEHAAERADVVLNRLSAPHRYFITVAPEKMPSPPDSLNRVAAEAAARVANSADWEHVQTIDDTIAIFRFGRR